MAFTYDEGWDLFNALANEPGTRLHASLNDWSFPQSRLERDTRLLLEGYFNVHRTDQAPLFDAGWPYPSAEHVPDDVRAELTEQLIRRSPLADR